ncbi:MAG: hypothetical protein PVI59_08165 [Anaerolineae bacterium]
MRKWRTALAALMLLGLIGVIEGPQLLAAPSFQENQYMISYPTEGALVSGVVEIRGTVAHPSFDSYGVLYAPGPGPTGDSQWVQIVFGVQEPVVNGVLATWDTTLLDENGQPVVPNGVYTLALARYRDGSSEPDLQFVRNITVNNEAITPTAEPTEEATPLPTAVAATPTSVPIEQPPTTTPRPSPTPGPGETPTVEAGGAGGEGEDEEGGLTIPIDTVRLRNAFLDGAKVTLLLFALWGVYVLVKALVRYSLRTGLLDLDIDISQLWRKE